MTTSETKGLFSQGTLYAIFAGISAASASVWGKLALDDSVWKEFIGQSEQAEVIDH